MGEGNLFSENPPSITFLLKPTAKVKLKMKTKLEIKMSLILVLFWETPAGMGGGEKA